jgi:hypothetical protein
MIALDTNIALPRCADSAPSLWSAERDFSRFPNLGVANPLMP